ncbi:MAG TPA: nucleoside triphosphate pyrophosphohydrolase family protein [Candidatus Krumholzibacteria bacterium]|nr:nucleoside triphosphate pyrophosphohydrolase family protein [Candidatus Krumholzibacteria bacterium]HPD73439.1 nucleoside triphosphate pyrophosphohydrolase family protein [Candidatus Krumholzibacteria bacterium]
MSIFDDQAKMMEAFGQSTGFDYEQASMYETLVEEETKELQEAMNTLHNHWAEHGRITTGHLVNVADGIVDSIVVLSGLGISLGLPMDRLWAEVFRSNMSKCGSDGKIHRREDGKVLKGPNYSPPNLGNIIGGL